MHKFFDPESVVMIGAPRKTGQGAYNGVEMMLRYGYRGRIYPINPKADQICGLKVYSSVAEVPEAADLAIISVGRDNVVEAFTQCIQSGIRRVIIISQGFSDADEHGRKLQSEIAGLARSSGTRVLGPNTLGTLNNFRNFSTGFVDLKKPEKAPAVSLIAQTGVLHVGSQEFSYHAWGKALDIGNACDVDFVDSLEYFGDDPETRVIVLHMEGVLRGRDFLEKAAQISRRKPIVVFKTGRSKAGARAALSHTGSLVGEDEINDAAFSRAGIIRVKNASELRDAIRALVRFEDMDGPRLGIITPTGAGGIMATDACEDFGLVIGELPKGVSEKLKSGVPDWINVGNPLDIWPIGMIGGGYAPVYELALTEMLKSPEIDGVVGMAFTSDSPMHTDLDLLQIVKSVREKTGSRKPLAMWLYGSVAPGVVDKFELIDSVACFGSIEQAIQGLSFLYRYNQIRKRKISSQREFPYKIKTAERLLGKGRKRGMLLGQDALALLSAFGIPVVRGKSARSWEEIKETASALAYPLVLKLSGEAFLHKSEWGGVVTGIRNQKELHAAYKKIIDAVRRRAPEVNIGFQVQEQTAGKELLMGLKNDPQFGHILACGMGGIYTEIFKDISRELVPVGRDDAEKMLSSLKISPLLRGVRGESGVDRESLLDTLERLSFLAARVPDISELDINPLMADVSGCRAVDARIIW
ncbi:MAG: acetate--CoA ligase family protein [Syntrophales bacterium]